MNSKNGILAPYGQVPISYVSTQSHRQRVSVSVALSTLTHVGIEKRSYFLGFWSVVSLRPIQQSLYELIMIENCPPASNASGYEVVDNIRRVAHSFGTVNSLKAYLELSELTSSRSLTLRSELQCSGVSLVDCPHNGRKDVADKMILGALIITPLPRN
jgi:hypothetical protein